MRHVHLRIDRAPQGGVVISYGALANLLQAMADTLGSAPGHRWLGLTSLSFDVSGLELHPPLATGGCLVIAPESDTLDGAALNRLIRDRQVTQVQATPSGWSLLLEAGFAPAPLVALAGGEALPPALAAKLRARVDRLINLYGPTETTIWSTWAEVPPEPEAVTIGPPLANTTPRLFDDRMREVPAGVLGRLWIGGRGLATGYPGRSDLTAKRFVPDPFGAAATCCTRPEACAAGRRPAS